MDGFRDQKVFITGAASGIGRALAAACAAEGAQLFLTDINAAGLQQAAAELGGAVRGARALDIADYDSLRAWAQELHAAHGSMDVLMNVAGIAVWGAAEALEHRQWRKVIDVNLMGPIHVIECFLPAMIAAGRGGHLVNVSSAAGLFGLPWHAAYSASKFGLRGISEVLRFDLARHGIAVHLVCPGGVDTGLVKTVEIQGIDINHPRIAAMRGRFQRHAVSPARAAAAIMKGVRRGRYLIFTSLDVRIGYWFQRKFAWPYEWAMRLINRYFHRVMREARR